MTTPSPRPPKTPKHSETDIAQFNPDDKICQWTIKKKLGQGGFGAVYLVHGDKEDETFALKVEYDSEKLENSAKILKMEFFVLTDLKRTRGRHFCDLIDSGKVDNYKYIVMTLVGPSLCDLREWCGVLKKFTLGCALSVGIQCVEAIEDLHRAGYLHRDIKPANFAIGISDPRKIYMQVFRRLTLIIVCRLDFGMCRRYLDQNGSIKTPRWAAGFREQSRKDDLETWFYMQVELTTGRLPWKNIEDKDEVGRCKERCRYEPMLKVFSSGLPTQLLEVMKYVDDLKYYSTPDYHRIYTLLRTAICANNVQEFPYDWERGLAQQSSSRIN